jgi:hypothetical protein
MDATFVLRMELQSIVPRLLKMCDVTTPIVPICIVWETQRIPLPNKKFKRAMSRVEEMSWRVSNKLLPNN